MLAERGVHNREGAPSESLFLHLIPPKKYSG